MGLGFGPRALAALRQLQERQDAERRQRAGGIVKTFGRPRQGAGPLKPSIATKKRTDQ